MSSSPSLLGAAFFEFLRNNKVEFNYDENQGSCDPVPFSRLTAAYPSLVFYTTNGGSWFRKSAKLFENYEVNSIRGLKPNGKHGVIALQLQGKKITITHRISPSIVKTLRDAKCVVTACHPSNKCQVDHKNGRYNDESLNDVANQSIKDFQPLHPAVNTIKREHCKKCAESGFRFDARILGHSVGWTAGDATYQGTCAGCYWYDPVKFNSDVVAVSLSIQKREPIGSLPNQDNQDNF